MSEKQLCSEMQYRVAQAIHEVVFPHEVQGEHWGGAGTVEGLRCIEAARAAILAMREPPKCLDDPYWYLRVEGATLNNGANAKGLWTRLIEDALL